MNSRLLRALATLAVAGGTATGVPAVATAAPAPAPAPAAPKISVGPGTKLVFLGEKIGEDRYKAQGACTLGWIAQDAAGKKFGLTQGHCGKPGTKVGVDNYIVGTVVKGAWDPSKESVASPRATFVNGPVTPATVDAGVRYLGTLGDSADWGVIEFADRLPVNGSRGAITPSGVGKARTGDPVCAEGITTGRKCGKVLAVRGNWILTDVQSRPGDSGGPLIRTSDNAAVGLTSGIYGFEVGENKFAIIGSTAYDLGATLRLAGLTLVK